MTALGAAHQSYEAHQLGRDAFAVTADLEKLVGGNDRRVEPFDMAETLGPEGHAHIPTVDLGKNFGDTIFRKPNCIRQARRRFQNSHNHHPNNDDNLPVVIGSQIFHPRNLNERACGCGIRSCSNLEHGTLQSTHNPYNFITRFT